MLFTPKAFQGSEKSTVDFIYMIAHCNLLSEFARINKISCSLFRIKYTALVLLDFFTNKFHFLKTEVSDILYPWNIQVKIFSDDDIFNNLCAPYAL